MMNNLILIFTWMAGMRTLFIANFGKMAFEVPDMFPQLHWRSKLYNLNLYVICGICFLLALFGHFVGDVTHFLENTCDISTSSLVPTVQVALIISFCFYSLCGLINSIFNDICQRRLVKICPSYQFSYKGNVIELAQKLSALSKAELWIACRLWSGETLFQQAYDKAVFHAESSVVSNNKKA